MATPAYLYPIDYTSRDYLSLREDLINVIRSRVPEWTADDPTDVGVALVEAFAYLGDVMSYYIDRAAAETFIGSASQRQSLLNISGILGYAPTGRVPAVTDLNFTNSLSTAATIEAGSRVTTAIRTGDQNIPLTFELGSNPTTSDGHWTIPASSAGTVSIPATEGYTIRNRVIGQTTGLPSQRLTIRDNPIINRSISVVINGQGYVYVQNMFDAGPDDAVFTYRTDELGVTTLTFGDGVSGLVPAANQDVYVTFRVGGGVIGNIARGQSFAASDFDFVGTITNPRQATGGADEETNEQIRANAYSAFRTRKNAVTKQDFADLALSDNRIAKAKARGNSYGNIIVYVAPVSSGDRKTDPTPGYDSYLVVSKARSGTTVTLTLAETPTFASGESVTISGMGSPYDGTFTVTVTGNNIAYTVGGSATVTTTDASGVVVVDEISTFATTRAEVEKNLTARGVIGSIVRVQPPRYLDLAMTVTIGVRPEYRQSRATAATRSALLALFAYNNVDFNLAVRPQEILAELTGVTELAYADIALRPSVGDSGTTSLIQSASDQIVRLLDANLTIVVDPSMPGIEA